ncbi:E3 ubiquitin-protein ligase MARCH5-like [Thalassophryne amazonica]|uniref:E3 ubiquitin-protein ligase MARCH5-like n=1 Tax=Thalassophryne amazonica TaxID=390379 RepID=UPI001470A177|nr:E3 ubiquitin-protein ligase MARCH5-like [Thalassophryne amazonica]
MAEQNAVATLPSLDRSCWVCFATDEDDRTAEWVRPCRCRGSTKWVHQSCLQRWVDEKQRGNSTARVACPQCNAEYLIVFPKLVPHSAELPVPSPPERKQPSEEESTESEDGENSEVDCDITDTVCEGILTSQVKEI